MSGTTTGGQVIETQQGKLNQYTLDKKGKQISFGVALATLSPGEQPPRVTMLSRVDHRDEFEAFQVSAPDVDYIIMVQNDPAQSSAMQLPDLNLATTSPVLVAAVGNDEVMWQVEALSGETAGAS